MVGDCDSTIATLRKTNTVVDNLPFLVEPSGDMHISDPRAVAIGNPGKNVGTVKALRESASGPRSPRRAFAWSAAKRGS
ncbi:hypothethical protein (plasmid) [Ralstonia solanacearum CMR15]|nr:hypothethical protein [Ralstonia solanacearum CMR15]